jgi:hypothetical protein
MRDKLLCVLLYVVINQSVIQISNLCLDSVLRDLAIAVDDTTASMAVFMLAMLAGMRAFFRSRVDLGLEIPALRQQVAVIKRKRPRPSVHSSDRLFWVLLHQFWSSWKSVLIVVKPDTVVGWHRTGYRWYWRWKSLRRRGWPRVTTEVRELIVRLAEENIG